MRKIGALFLFCLAANVASAQQTIQNIAYPVYEQLKSTRSLDPSIHYVIDPTTIPVATNSGLPLPPPPSSTASTSGCACYIPPDASYSIVPFAGYAPPNYENDDGSTANIPIPFNFCLYGTNYTSMWINNNGNITFDGPYATFSPVGFPSNQYVMVAPFWGDVDTRNGGGLVYYKITPTAVYVTWVNVGYYAFHTDLLNTFSVIITDANDPVIGVGNNVAFCYQDMQWTTGDASGGSGGFGGFAATVGCNKGNGIDFVQFGQFDSPGTAYFGPYATNNGVSWLDNQSFIFNACNSTNIAPTMATGPICDTIELCVGDTLVDTLVFLSPEPGQTTTLGASSASPDFSILNITNGNTATLIYQVIGNTVGTLDINVNAVDDGVPVQNVNYTITVQVNPNNTPIPTVIGDTIICPGENTILSAIGGVYDSYLWNTGGINDSVTVNQGGNYLVEVSLNGCRRWDSITVFAFPQPVPLITADTTICGGDSSLMTVTNGPFNQYSWSTGSTTSTAYAATAGTYTVTVTDNNTCTGSSTINVVQVVPVININSALAVCGGDSVMMTATPFLPFSSIYWSDGTIGPLNYATSPGQYIVTGVDPGGCEAKDTVVIALLPDPTGNLVLPVACENQGSAFSYNNTGIPVIDYHWNFGTGIPGDTSNISSPNFTYPLFGFYNVSLVITGSNGCIDTIQANLTVHTQPTVTVPNTPICLDAVATFNPTIVSDSVVSYSWVFAGGTPGTSNILTPTVSYPAPGSYPYLLTVTTEFGCTTVVAQNLVVRENPSAGFGIYPICVSRFTFDYIPGVNDSALVLDWNMGDGTWFLDQDTTVFNYLYPGPGVFNVQLVVQNGWGCTDSLTIPLVVPDSVFLELPNVLIQSSLVGNDRVDIEQIEPSFNLCIEYTYSIYDRWGIKVFETHNDPNNPDMSCGKCFKGKTQGGEQLSPGVYYYILQGNFNIQKVGFITIFD